MKARAIASIFVLSILALGLLSARKFTPPSETVVWKLENLKDIGGYQPTVLGNPKLLTDDTGKSILFNGIDDGLVMPAIPVEGWKRFTVEVLFKPDSKGPIAPRFIHFEDKDLNRGTFEIRLTPDGQWYLDTFLKNGNPDKSNKGLALIDSSLLHPSDRWYWAAIVYDGKRMFSYINGQKELEGNIDLPPFTSGKLSIGVRLNKVNWFKGQIKEIRFHPSALDVTALQKF